MRRFHRVLFVHHRPQASGAARSLALLIGALPKEWESHVLVPGGAAGRLFEESGARVHEGPVPAFTHTWDVQYHGLRWLVAAREAARLPAHAAALRRVLRMVQPDIVHVNDGVMLATGALAARAGIPVVWHLRSSLANEGRDARSRLVARVIDRFGAAAIAIDEDVAGTYPLRLAVEVIPNPALAVPGVPIDLEIPPGRLAVGYFGYLRRQKGWPQFLQALRLLAENGVEVHGVIVGGGIRPSSSFHGLRGRLLKAVDVPDEEGDLDRTVEELGIADRLTRLPFTDDVGPVLRALDVVVFPNQGKGLGRPVLEAAAYGIPVVASGSPHGAGLLVDGVTGLLLEAGTAQSVAQAIRILADDARLRTRMGIAARDHITRPGDAARRVAEIYRGIVSDAG